VSVLKERHHSIQNENIKKRFLCDLVCISKTLKLLDDPSTTALEKEAANNFE